MEREKQALIDFANELNGVNELICRMPNLTFPDFSRANHSLIGWIRVIDEFLGMERRKCCSRNIYAMRREIMNG